MVEAIKQIVTVTADGVIQVRAEQFKVGARAEVIVLLEESRTARTMSSMIGGTATLPLAKMADWFGAGKGQFSSVEEIDAYIREERDWGDRDR